MAVIDNFRGILTIFCEYKTDDGSPEELLEKLKPIFINHIKEYPGLISYNLHLSLESNSVFNYFQWKDEETYLAFMEDDPIQDHFSKITGLHCQSTKTKVVLAS